MKWRWRGRHYHSWQERNAAMKAVYDRTRWVFIDRGVLIARQMDNDELRFSLDRRGEETIIGDFPARTAAPAASAIAESC
jgi:hypothetical protein